MFYIKESRPTLEYFQFTYGCPWHAQISNSAYMVKSYFLLENLWTKSVQLKQ